jgi:putative transposase
MPLGKRHSPEQIVRKLRQVEGKLASGSTLPQVARDLSISEATFHRSKGTATQRDELTRGQASQGALKKENARLKKLLAEKELDIAIFKEVSRGNF